MAKAVQSNRHFEEWSKTYEVSSIQGIIFDRVHRAALAQVPQGLQPGSILDIGCGSGRLLRKAAARWPRANLYGVDLAEGMIAEARALTPGATLLAGAAENLPLPDESIDLALSTVSFHHWQDQGAGFRQVMRVLRPGGFFVLADLALPFHGTPARPWALRKMFAQAGLTLRTKKWTWLMYLVIAVGEKK